ncbi:MAG: sugar O-acetyltransferase [Fermentimonas sp.]
MKTELQKCLDGEPFMGGDPELLGMAVNAKRLIKELNDIDYADFESKRAIHKKLFGSVGYDVFIDIDFHCEYGKHIHIGNKVIINMNCTFVDNNLIEIGNNVLIASNVQIYTATHSTIASERVNIGSKQGEEFCRTYALPIKIEDHVWIGGGAIILPGVTIGKGSVIGAGSVVTRSIPANCVAVGNPCRVIKHIDNNDI